MTPTAPISHPHSSPCFTTRVERYPPASGESPNQASRAYQPAWKRGIDVTCCVLVLPILAVCALGWSLVTQWTAPGPIFYRQKRIGWKGRTFEILKFRTMHVGSSTVGHSCYVQGLIGTDAPMRKLDATGDARLIPGSWLLRASGIDELPQIINVLRGEMSLVGPRPCLPAEFAAFLPSQRKRCASLPGLTGLWQVSGKNRTTFKEMIQLDIRYVETISWRLDLKIILLTLPALLTQIREARCDRKSPRPAVNARG